MRVCVYIYIYMCVCVCVCVCVCIHIIITWRRSGWKSMLQKTTDSLFDSQKCCISWPLNYWVCWQVHLLAGRSHIHFLHHVNLKENDARICRVCLFWIYIIRQEDGCNYSCALTAKMRKVKVVYLGEGNLCFRISLGSALFVLLIKSRVRVKALEWRQCIVNNNGRGISIYPLMLKTGVHKSRAQDWQGD